MQGLEGDLCGELFKYATFEKPKTKKRRPPLMKIELPAEQIYKFSLLTLPRAFSEKYHNKVYRRSAFSIAREWTATIRRSLTLFFYSSLVVFESFLCERKFCFWLCLDWKWSRSGTAVACCCRCRASLCPTCQLFFGLRWKRSWVLQNRARIEQIKEKITQLIFSVNDYCGVSVAWAVFVVVVRISYGWLIYDLWVNETRSSRSIAIHSWNWDIRNARKVKNLHFLRSAERCQRPSNLSWFYFRARTAYTASYVKNCTSSRFSLSQIPKENFVPKSLSRAHKTSNRCCPRSTHKQLRRARFMQKHNIRALVKLENF